MATSSILLLLELAQKQTDASAKKLGKLNAIQQEAEKKLQLLVQYRQSYQSYLQDAIAKGVDQAELLNFMAFMTKLDAAIAEQKHALVHAQNNRMAANQEFLASQRKLKSFETLLQRQHMAENKKQLKSEQKLQDEFSANAYHRTSSAPKEN
ncbi:flagellar export protein FliJ [Nitrosomonas sp. JL21]|uniref:flagellar export protein FliJ n=1 Tax=Nitrosomonas sp. JL21 TaxID=153949 RepID=UPI001368ABDE|nr:flagellar export protein FliJ [Nitrosomonas sp. JL21]MBL8497186.1 flagellar export protein FliJ [Nitrosomonas sp.]MCC7092335.1 flagellar export protein FliJ [Nitrosomonas sp.]MXS76657.1 flagellar export protein FliJ [Nitrosomonas sp. JL21]